MQGQLLNCSDFYCKNEVQAWGIGIVGEGHSGQAFTAQGTEAVYSYKPSIWEGEVTRTLGISSHMGEF